jgi:hypothetical protein
VDPGAPRVVAPGGEQHDDGPKERFGSPMKIQPLSVGSPGSSISSNAAGWTLAPTFPALA